MRSAEVSPSGATSLPASEVARGASRLSTGTLHLCKVALWGLSLRPCGCVPTKHPPAGAAGVAAVPEGCSAGWAPTRGQQHFPAWPLLSACAWWAMGTPKEQKSPPHHPRLFPWLCFCSYILLQQSQHWGTEEWGPTPPGTSEAKTVWETLPESKICREPGMDLAQYGQGWGSCIPLWPLPARTPQGEAGRAGAKCFQPEAERR